MGFVPYLHIGHNKGIEKGCPTSGRGRDNIVNPPSWLRLRSMAMPAEGGWCPRAGVPCTLRVGGIPLGAWEWQGDTLVGASKGRARILFGPGLRRSAGE